MSTFFIIILILLAYFFDSLGIYFLIKIFKLSDEIFEKIFCVAGIIAFATVIILITLHFLGL